MSDATATRPPRSAAARRAAGEPANAPSEGDAARDAQTSDEGGAAPDEVTRLKDQVAAAQEDARLAREEAELVREEMEARQAGAPIQVTDPVEVQQPSAAALRAGATEPAVASSGIASAVPGDAVPEGLTGAEWDLINRVRQGRGAEILQRIRQAPDAVGTNLDQFTLVHLRGCPKPDRTETYEAEAPSGQKYTIHRCVECGAHLPIPH